jgi:hypothetical protein
MKEILSSHSSPALREKRVLVFRLTHYDHFNPGGEVGDRINRTSRLWQIWKECLIPRRPRRRTLLQRY